MSLLNAQPDPVLIAGHPLAIPALSLRVDNIINRSDTEIPDDWGPFAIAAAIVEPAPTMEEHERFKYGWRESPSPIDQVYCRRIGSVDVYISKHGDLGYWATDQEKVPRQPKSSQLDARWQCAARQQQLNWQCFAIRNHRLEQGCIGDPIGEYPSASGDEGGAVYPACRTAPRTAGTCRRLAKLMRARSRRADLHLEDFVTKCADLPETRLGRP